MGVRQVGVLVNFIRVVSGDASLGRKGKLGNDVVDRIRVSGYGFFGW